MEDSEDKGGPAFPALEDVPSVAMQRAAAASVALPNKLRRMTEEDRTRILEKIHGPGGALAPSPKEVYSDAAEPSSTPPPGGESPAEDDEAREGVLPDEATLSPSTREFLRRYEHAYAPRPRALGHSRGVLSLMIGVGAAALAWFIL